MIKKINKHFTIYFIIISLIICLHYISVLNPLEKIVRLSFSPFQTFLYSSSKLITTNFEKKPSVNTLKNENQELQKKINVLEEKIVELKMFIEENKIITKQTEYLKSRQLSSIEARVISVGHNSNPNILVLDRGTSDGIKKGMIAIIDQGIVVGKIISVNSDNSYLVLPIDNQCRLSATKLDESNIIGFTQGNLNNAIELQDILKNNELNINDIIITSGRDEYIPAGFIIGEVEKVNDQEGQLFKSAILKSNANLRHLRLVSVVIQ